MISFLDYIIFICKKYNNFSEYFISEIGNSITIFQFFNCIILNLIILFFVIRFFIKTWGFYILRFIFIRFIIANIILLLVYIVSDFTICETEINKSSVNYLNNINIDDTKKKYIAITCFLLIGGYLLYKYVPMHLEGLKPQNDLLIDRSKYQAYQNWILEHTKSQNNYDSQNYNFKKSITKLEELQRGIDLELERFSIFRPEATILNDIFLPKFGRLIKEEDFLHYPDIESFNYSQYTIENNLIVIKEKMVHLMAGNQHFNCTEKLRFDFNSLIENETQMIAKLSNLELTYNKYWDQYDSSVEGGVTSCISIADFAFYVNNDLITILNCQNNILRMFDESDRIIQFLPYLDTSSCKILPIEYINDLKYFIFNVSYLIFYPTFFIFNKILGVHNPFIFKLFKDSIWYFITLKIFY